ncbi:MAG: DUF5668 domain-containing protein [Ignavibacteria bacterium]
MKSKQLFWGIFFVALGGLVLINNFVKISFNWAIILDLWPLAFVILGLYFILKDNPVRWLFIVINALFIAFVLFAAFKSFSTFIDDDTEFHGNYNVQHFNAPFNENVKKVNFTLETGGGHIYIKDTSMVDLVDARFEGSSGEYNFNHSDKGEDADVILSLEHGDIHFVKEAFKNALHLKLNEKPIWNMDFNIGASKLDLDLTPFKTENINFKSGAASIRVKIGDKIEMTNLRFEAGVTKIEVQIPKSSGCEIRSDASLSSKRFDGFNKIDKSTYRTENYDSAAKKIIIEFDTGVSSIEVDRI